MKLAHLKYEQIKALLGMVIALYSRSSAAFSHMMVVVFSPKEIEKPATYVTKRRSPSEKRISSSSSSSRGIRPLLLRQQQQQQQRHRPQPQPFRLSRRMHGSAKMMEQSDACEIAKDEMKTKYLIVQDTVQQQKQKNMIRSFHIKYSFNQAHAKLLCSRNILMQPGTAGRALWHQLGKHRKKWILFPLYVWKGEQCRPGPTSEMAKKQRERNKMHLFAREFPARPGGLSSIPSG